MFAVTLRADRKHDEHQRLIADFVVREERFAPSGYGLRFGLRLKAARGEGYVILKERVSGDEGINASPESEVFAVDPALVDSLCGWLVSEREINRPG